MSLANSYYAASCYAYAQFYTAPWQYKLLWGWRALWCFLQARHLSYKHARQGLGSMTANELDAYARFLLRQKRYEKAKHVIAIALHKKRLSVDAQVMLWVLLMEAYVGFFKRYKGRQNLVSANQWYARIAKNVDYLEPTARKQVLDALAKFKLEQGNLEVA
jgi:hypothetical protein